MVVDHIALYLIPEYDWLHVIGRIAFPLFLFLVGYSNKFDFSPLLLATGVGVAVSTTLTGHALFPLNILITILLTRTLLNVVTKTRVISHELPMVWIALLIFYVPLMFLIEYGTLGAMVALCGWLWRKYPQANHTFGFILATGAWWCITQSLSFNLTFPMQLVVIWEGIMLAYGLQYFSREGHLTPLPVSPLCSSIISWMGRNTLYLYMVHIILFQLIEYHFWPEHLAEGLR